MVPNDHCQIEHSIKQVMPTVERSGSSGAKAVPGFLNQLQFFLSAASLKPD